MLRNAKEIAAKSLTKFKPTLFDDGVGARLPKEYRKFYDEWRNTKPEPVHYIPETRTWVRNEETGEVKRLEDIPLPTFVPPELNQVFTGGEKFLFGFLKKTKPKYSSRVPRFWAPTAYRSVVYSEILDKYLSVLMTKRVVELIHKHEGFDNYLLQTKACDLSSLVAIKLKKKILTVLMEKNLPYDDKKNHEIYEKYKEYLIPPEELKWYGLSFGEACRQQEEIEKAAKLASIVPLKQIYRKHLVETLKLKKNN